VRKHDLDWVALIAGVLFTGLAAAYLVAAVSDRTVDGRFVWPLVLVAIGAAGVVAAVRANSREEKAFAPLDPPDDTTV
jgi:peptidoglycan/LPS O-acetylase OafA/YrhL